MSKARNLSALLSADGKVEADDLDVGQIGGRRNLIINGAMQVWQRGTSSTNTGLNYFTADRFWTYNAPSQQRSDVVPTGQGFGYSLNFPTTMGPLGTSVELTAQGKSQLKANTDYTFSFWVKSDVASSSCGVTHRYRDARGYVANTSNIDGGSSNFSVSTGWQRVSITFNTGTSAPNPTNRMIDLEFYGLADLRNSFWTGFQFEEGSVATPFEHRSYGEELALCQRYYQKGKLLSTGTGTVSYLTASSVLRTVMRTSPSFTVYDTAGNAGKVSGDSTTNIPANIWGGDDHVIVGAQNYTIGTNVYMNGIFKADAEL